MINNRIVIPDGGGLVVAKRSAGGSIDIVQAIRAGLLSEAGRDRITKPYAQSVWIYACVWAIAHNLSTLPIRVYIGPESKPRPVESGPLVDLFENPSLDPDTDSETWWFWNAMYMCLRGHVFIVPYLDGKPVTKPVMPKTFGMVAPSLCTPVPKSDGITLDYWNVGGNESTQLPKLDPNLIIHPYWPHPYEKFVGLAPAEAAMTAASSAFQADLFNESFFKNNGDPGGWITAAKPLGKDALSMMEKSFLDRFGGSRNAGRVMMLDNGATFTPNPRTQKDMQWLEGMADARDRICAVFGVPKGILSVTDGINYATRIAEERAFYERAIIPLGRKLARSVNRWLRRAGVQEWIAFDTTNVEALADRVSDKAMTAKTMVDMGIPLQDVNDRLRLGLPSRPWYSEGWAQGSPTSYNTLAKLPPDERTGPIKDFAMQGPQIVALTALIAEITAGNIAPEAAKIMLPLAFPMITPADAAAMVDAAAAHVAPPKPVVGVAAPGALATATPAQPAPAQRGTPAPPSDSSSSVPPATQPDKTGAGNGERRIALRRLLSSRSAADRRRIVEERQKNLILPAERRMRRLVLAELGRQRRDVAGLFKGRGQARGWSLRRDLTTADADAIAALRDRWNARLREIFGPAYGRTIEQAVLSGAAEVGLAFAFNATDPRWLEIGASGIGSLVKTSSTTIAALRSALIQAISEGKTTSDIQAVLMGIFDGSEARSLLIARTEVGQLASEALNEVYVEAGVEKQQWISSADDLVRESHQEVDGEVVALGERFSNGLLHPHDMGADDPAEVCNCRCDVGAVE